ncbi:uncharacterized protein WM294_013929 [Sarcoramphus papa]
MQRAGGPTSTRQSAGMAKSAALLLWEPGGTGQPVGRERRVAAGIPEVSNASRASPRGCTTGVPGSVGLGQLWGRGCGARVGGPGITGMEMWGLAPCSWGCCGVGDTGTGLWGWEHGNDGDVEMEMCRGAGGGVPMPCASRGGSGVPKPCTSRGWLCHPDVVSVLGTVPAPFPMGAGVPTGAAWGQPLCPVPLGAGVPVAAAPTQPLSPSPFQPKPSASLVSPRCRFPTPLSPDTLSGPGQAGVPCHPTGTQPSQLTLDPPWMPVLLSEKVTLTCQGSSAPGSTDWYTNGRLSWQAGPKQIRISNDRPGRRSYQCRSPGAGLSPVITLNFLNDWLVLQVPAWALLEGDPLPLRCRGWKDTRVTQVRFFREREALRGSSQGAELLLPAVQLHHSGRYSCQATVGNVFPKWEESAPVMVVVQELFSVPVLHLEGPAEPPEGAPLALGCLSHPSPLRPLVHLRHLFYRDEVVVGGPQGSPQLRLPAMELSHSGNYSCEVRTETASVQKRSAPVTVTVRRIPVSGVSLVAQPPGGQVVEGDRLVLDCSVATGTGPLSFSWYRQGSAAPLATGPCYKLRTVRHQDSGRYHCTATNGGTAVDSPPLWVTVLVPVADATITMARTEPLVLAGESLNLSCSVRTGTAPVTFTWLRDGQELGSGPVLSLETVGPAHAGSYQCLATNRLGAHRIFRACSPALALSVTQPEQGWQQQGTAVAVGLSVSLLFLLLLLLAAAIGWHLRRRHRAAHIPLSHLGVQYPQMTLAYRAKLRSPSLGVLGVSGVPGVPRRCHPGDPRAAHAPPCLAAAGNSRGRDPAAPPEPEGRRPEPTAPPGAPEDGEVLYTHVLVTERGAGTSPSRSPRGSPRSAPPREPSVTYAVLPGPHARLRLPSDTYENVP